MEGRKEGGREGGSEVKKETARLNKRNSQQFGKGKGSRGKQNQRGRAMGPEGNGSIKEKGKTPHPTVRLDLT